MTEKIIIQNFGGIGNIDIHLNKINIITGPQASGKSITAKLIFYFKSFFTEIRNGIENKKTKAEIDRGHHNKFLTFFPKETWPSGNFSVRYITGNTWMSISKYSNKPMVFEYSDDIKTVIEKGRAIFRKEQAISKESIHLQNPINFFNNYNELLKNEISENASFNQIFIPAGRSFFSNIQATIFSFLSTNKSLDPFLIEFGAFYEKLKQVARDENLSKSSIEFEQLMNSILNSKYLRVKEKDYLLHSDARKVNLSNASSGQQEILPLLLILKALMVVRFSGGGATLYIEEPEAHLFPDAQKKIIRLLSRLFNSKKSGFQIFVTTHSPYILSSYNNLLYAGSILKKDKEKEEKVFRIVSENEIIDPASLSAFSLTMSGEATNLIDKETALISQNMLDNVSNEISMEFGELLDVDYGN